jgi:tRNA threonylcarbamoyladenosine biosynthesis protein TsaE
LQFAKYLCPVEITYKLDNIKIAATKFWKAIGDKKTIALHGNMGAGKTTFIHALCVAKGVKEVISSPTFSIINEYSFPGGMIYHIDLYRLKDEEEALRVGVEDCLYSNHICFVEWPEKAPGLFPTDTMHAFIEVVNSDTRHLTLKE